MMTEIEKAVENTIEKIYCAKYTGALSVTTLYTEDNNIRGYLLRLGMNNLERPISISFEGDELSFIKYLTKELSSRHLADLSFYDGYQVYKNE